LYIKYKGFEVALSTYPQVSIILETLVNISKNNCWPVGMWIKRTIIKNEYFVAQSIDYVTKRVIDRPDLRSKRPFFSMGHHTHPQLSRTVARTMSPYPQGREFKGY